jgi:nicotinate-nucleotide adenylyltransferase
LGVTLSAGLERRIGVFGGAFDPPHLGHYALAHTAIAQLQLDCLHIVPTGTALHKTRTLSSAEHRLAMTALAFGDLPQVRIDPRETQRVGPSFTVDTLTELSQENPQAQLYLILGADQAQALPTWHRWRELFQLAIICIAGRADHSGAAGTFSLKSVHFERCIQLAMPGVPLSATQIRQKLGRRQSISALVNDSVARYIASHHLYLVA